MAIRFTLYITILLLCSCHDSSIHHGGKNEKLNTEPTQTNNTFEILFDKEIYYVGELISINVIQNGNHLINSKLIVDNGPQIYLKHLLNTEDNFLVLPESFSMHAGSYTFCVSYSGHCLTTSEIIVHPLSSNKIYTLTGPRTINADGADASMIVNIPEDIYGNVVKEGTSIYYESISKSKNEAQSIVPVKDQLSYTIILSDRKATSQFVGITDLKNSSLEQRIDFVSQWPYKILISNDDYYPYANNKDFIDIKTEILYDDNKNKISEGTYIRYIMTDERGQRSLYNSLVVDGVSRVRIKNPELPGTYYIYAQSSDGTISNRLRLWFNSDLESINYNLTDSVLVIGPLKSQLGQLISEGTKVDLVINDQLYREETYKGIAQFELKYLDYSPKDEFKILVAGQNAKGKFK